MKALASALWERILWMDKDEPVAASDQRVEKDLLGAIGKSL